MRAIIMMGNCACTTFAAAPDDQICNSQEKEEQYLLQHHGMIWHRLYEKHEFTEFKTGLLGVLLQPNRFLDTPLFAT